MRRFHHLAFSVSLAAAAAVLSQTVPAQRAYGSGTAGSGGLTPRLTAQQAWLGRSSWGLAVDGALGGAPCVVVGSAFPVNAVQQGLHLLVDLNSTLGSFFFLLQGSPGAPGAGTGFLPLPLGNLPPSPVLAGTDFFFQAFPFDAQGAPVGPGLSSSNGLVATLTMPPALFAATGGGDWYQIDPANPVAVQSGNDPLLASATGVLFTGGGLDLYVATSGGQLVHGDLRGSPPQWSSLNSGLGTTVAAWANLAYDPVRKIGWVSGRGGTGTMEMMVVDLDPASATYGQLLAGTTGMQAAIGPFGAWGMSPDRRRLAAASPWNGSLAIVDSDPGSPTFLQVLAVTPIPPSTVAPGFTVNNFICFDPTGQRVYLARQNQNTNPGEIACYDLQTGWVDHDPQTPFLIEHLGSASVPPITLPPGLRSLAMAPDGSALYAAGSALGQGFAVRVELSPLGFTLPTGTVSLSTATRLALDADGGRLAVAVTGKIVLFDTATMAQSAVVPLASGSTVEDLGWR